MDEREREKIWKEMVERDERRGWRNELVSDLKLLVIMLVVWISFFGVVEITGAGGC